MYTEKVSGWPTVLVCFSAYNSTKPKYFAVTFCLLACIYSLAAPLNSGIHSIMLIGSHKVNPCILQPQLVLHGMIINQLK